MILYVLLFVIMFMCLKLMLKNININRKRGKTLISALYSCIWCGLLSSSLAKLSKYVVLFFSHVPPFSPHEKNLPFASIKQHTIRFQSQFFLYAKCVLMIFVIITMHLQIMILENAAYEMENIKLYYFTENIYSSNGCLLFCLVFFEPRLFRL